MKLNTFSTVAAAVFFLSLSINAKASDELLTEVNDELVTTESLEGALSINWVKPKSYTDVRRSNGNSRSKKYRHFVFKKLHGVFEDLLERLPDGYSMSLEVTNLDLAGDTRFGSAAIGLHRVGHSFNSLDDVRVMRTIDIPRMDFSYKIKDANGEVLFEETVNVKDMNYLQGASRIKSSKPLYYERQMLTKWFRSEFKEELTSDS